MERITLQTPQDVGNLAGELVANRLRAFPDLRIALPTGQTPIPMYSRLQNLYRRGLLATSRATLVQLDEYLGEDTMQKDLEKNIGDIRFARNIFWNEGGSSLPESLDLVVLGIGANGHVAFCEPGHTGGDRWIEVPLSHSTQSANQTRAARARTLALPYLRSAREIVLLATGSSKREILERALQGPPSSECPASLLMDHPRITVLADQEASNQQPRKGGQAVVALGCRNHHGHYSPSASVRASTAARLAARIDADYLVFSGGALQGRETEAEKMYAETPSRVPCLLEEASDRSSAHLPFTEPLLQNRKIIFVSSWWHLPRLRWMHRGVPGISFYPAWETAGLRGEKRFQEEIRGLKHADADRRYSLGRIEEGLWTLSYKEKERLTKEEIGARLALLLENLGPEQFDLLVSGKTPSGRVLSGGQLLGALQEKDIQKSN